MAFGNLLGAWKKARKGKKYTQSAAAFWVEQERELLKLQDELRAEKWQPGAYLLKSQATTSGSAAKRH